MTPQVAAILALGYVLAVWIGKANLPPAVVNAVALVFAVLLTFLLFVLSVGWSVP